MLDKVIFLDRDGVVNKETNYLYETTKFEFIDGVFEACSSFKALGYKIIIITNQSGIARGYYSNNDFKKLTEWMLEKFKDNNIDILDVLYCPHSPNSNCLCRKPKPGLIFEAYKKFQINIKESWLIGDQETDIETARAAGINNTILVKSGHPVDELNSNASFILKSIKECTLIINN